MMLLFLRSSRIIHVFLVQGFFFSVNTATPRPVNKLLAVEHDTKLEAHILTL